MLSAAIIRLISGKANGETNCAARLYYAELLQLMNRIITTEVPTLGVNVTDKINLYINPYFWNSLDIDEQVAVLIHECSHITHDHISRFKDIIPELEEAMVNKKRSENVFKEFPICNQAGDYAINQHIDNLPQKIGVFSKDGEKIGEGEPCLVEKLRLLLPTVTIKDNETMEYYYGILKDNQEELKGKLQPGDQFLDDHSLWGEGNSNSEMVKEIIKNAVNKAAEETKQKAGNLPGDLNLLIDKLNHKPKNWKQDVRKFVANSIEILKDSSRKVRNRRYGLMYAGFKTYPKLVLGVGMDCSGSVSEELMNQMVAEIDSISKNDIKVYILDFDTQVNGVAEYSPKKKVKINGRGGTMFQPVLDKAQELEVDGLIMLTDGYNFDTIKKPKYPVLWAICDNGKKPVDWGTETKIEIKKKA